MRQIIAEGFKDVYFQDVTLNDIDHLGLDY